MPTTYGHPARQPGYRPQHRRHNDTAALTLLSGIWLGLGVLGTVMTAR